MTKTLHVKRLPRAVLIALAEMQVGRRVRSWELRFHPYLGLSFLMPDG